MLSALLDVLLPVLLVASVGVVLARRFPLNVDTLGKISLYGLTPALAFRSMMTSQISPEVGVQLVGGYLLVTAAGALLSWLATQRWPLDTRRSITACTIIGNNGNFGLPIALLALGNEGLDAAIVIFVVSLVIMFTIGPLLLGSTGGIRGGLLTMARLPVTWALAAAGVLRFTRVEVAGGLMSGIDLLADAAIPLVLLQLGVQIGTSGRIHRTPTVLAAVALRALLIPTLGISVGLLVGLDGLGLASLLLACAMPVAVNTFMLAREYGADTDTVASAVVLSTFCSIPVLLVLISWLPRILIWTP